MNVSAKEIARKNDLCRTTFLFCRVVLTRSVTVNPDREEIITAVREFSNFNDSNDPHQEHDFGSCTVNGKTYFWKIDLYDDNYEFFQEDGNRVLTIMEASEY